MATYELSSSSIIKEIKIVRHKSESGSKKKKKFHRSEVPCKAPKTKDSVLRVSRAYIIYSSFIVVGAVLLVP
jgi:hypothetical protein